LKEYFEDNLSHLCGDCRERFAQNPLRILDCKDEKCQRYIEKAPSSMEFLCPVCKGHYEKVKDLLGKQRIDFQLNPRLVRGLDYYTRTAFEIVARTLGAQNAVSGGGRYDTLVEELGGKTVPAIGFAIGLERVIEVLMKLQSGGQEEKGIDLFIAALGDAAVKIGFDILQKARGKGLSGEIDHLGKPLRAQMKMADRLGARKVIIIGEDEINKGKGVLRDMQTAQQQEIPFEEIVEVL
jgi:histidyl-tRNA synthetase